MKAHDTIFYREKDLMLTSAIDMCQAAELTDAHMKALTHKSDYSINAVDTRQPCAKCTNSTNHERKRGKGT